MFHRKGGFVLIRDLLDHARLKHNLDQHIWTIHTNESDKESEQKIVNQ